MAKNLNHAHEVSQRQILADDKALDLQRQSAGTNIQTSHGTNMLAGDCARVDLMELGEMCGVEGFIAENPID